MALGCQSRYVHAAIQLWRVATYALLSFVTVVVSGSTSIWAQKAVPCSYHSDIASLVVRATAHRVSGLPHRALTELQHALQLDSSCAQLWVIAASTYRDMGQIERSIDAAQRALTYDSSCCDAYEILAELLITRDQQGASTYALHAWRCNPSLSNQLRAAYALRYVDTARAIELLREVFDKTAVPEIADNLVALCIEYRDTAQAVALLRRMLFEFPEQPDLAILLGQLYARRSQWDSAWYFIRYAFYHMATLDIGSTLNDWLETIHQAPTETIIQTGVFIAAQIDLACRYALAVAILLARRSVWEQARVLLERMFTRRELHQNEAFQAIELITEYEDAQYAEEVLRRRESMFGDPWVPIARFYLARTYGTLPPAQRLQLLTTALERDSTNPTALFYAAFAADSLGDTDHAIALYSRLIFFEPDNAAAVNNLAYILAVRGQRLGYALELAQRALDADSTNPSFLDTYGWVLHKLSRYAEASVYLQRAIEKSSVPSATLFEHVGDNYDKLGVADLARYWWRRAVEADPRRTYLLDRLR